MNIDAKPEEYPDDGWYTIEYINPNHIMASGCEARVVFLFGRYLNVQDRRYHGMKFEDFRESLARHKQQLVRMLP